MGADNGDGLLVAETVDGVETLFTWDLALDVPQVLATSDGTKNLYGLDRIGVEQGGAWRYSLPDALGSVRQWTDPAGGVLAAQSYGPFGEAREPVGTPPWGFTGEWQDPAGMVYLRARWYNPSLGRFTQVDPVAGLLTAPATQHPYTYALNNALRYTDASGRNVPWLIIGAAAVGAAIDYGAQVYRNRQAGSDWGAALTHVNVGEVLSAGAAAGLATAFVPELISWFGVSLAAGGTTLAASGIPFLQGLASYPMSWGPSVTQAAIVAEELIWTGSCELLSAQAPGNANYEDPLLEPGWKLTPEGEGAHLYERQNVPAHPEASMFDQPDTPRYYPYGSMRNAGEAHLRMHQATAAQGIARHGGNPDMSFGELTSAYGRAYSDSSLKGIRGDLRTPDGANVVGTNLSPSGAWNKLKEFFGIR